MSLQIDIASAISAEIERQGNRSADIVQVNAAPYVTIKLAASITGLSEKAINGKIDEGVWLEGKEWRKGPDGRRYISLRGYAAWVEQRR